MQLKGIHHVTAITSSAEKIYDFFTNILGLRLVKKTVNQDDIDTYHLFFADDLGSPGTDMTFFDFKGISKAVHGNNEINRTGFRVANDKSLEYWLKRFNHYKVKHSEIKTIFNKKIIEFEDFDGQLYALFSDEMDMGVKSGMPWKKGPVPDEFAITGLGPIYINVSRLDGINTILTEIFLMKQVKNEGNFYLYEMGEGGNGASLIINYEQNNKPSYQGYGAVHHIAFRVGSKDDLVKWEERLDKFGAPNSGYVDRFYFKSVYTRLYLNVLFELATDEPGFVDDEETLENLGETLALPPKFRNNRAYIEKVVRHIDTKRSDKVFKKEYFNE